MMVQRGYPVRFGVVIDTNKENNINENNDKYLNENMFARICYYLSTKYHPLLPLVFGEEVSSSIANDNNNINIQILEECFYNTLRRGKYVASKSIFEEMMLDENVNKHIKSANLLSKRVNINDFPSAFLNGQYLASENLNNIVQYMQKDEIIYKKLYKKKKITEKTTNFHEIILENAFTSINNKIINNNVEFVSLNDVENVENISWIVTTNNEANLKTLSHIYCLKYLYLFIYIL